jgi:hypothetical protein
VAEQCWTFEMPKGPKGRFVGVLPIIMGCWKFSKNKSAAKSLLHEIWQRHNFEKLLQASNGYDVPSFTNMSDFKIYTEVGPPQGTVYHYPPRADQTPWVSGAPAPANVGNQMYVQSIMTKMIAKCTQGGETIPKTLDWAASEIEGYART